MALPEMAATCTKCGTSLRAQPKLTLLAFLRFHCPSCQKDFLYPLTSGYRTTYRVLIVLMVLGIAVSLSEGRVGLPGVLPLIGVLALVKDGRIRKEVAKAEKGGVIARIIAPVGRSQVVSDAPRNVREQYAKMTAARVDELVGLYADLMEANKLVWPAESSLPASKTEIKEAIKRLVRRLHSMNKLSEQARDTARFSYGNLAMFVRDDIAARANNALRARIVPGNQAEYGALLQGFPKAEIDAAAAEQKTLLQEFDRDFPPGS